MNTPATEATKDGQPSGLAVASGSASEVRRGWRGFECDCGHKWEWPTRDRHSPSGENCPKCDEWVFPSSSRPDASLPCDKSGNLLFAWNAEPNK